VEEDDGRKGRSRKRSEDPEYTPASVEIASVIRDAILSGELRPGEHIGQEQFAKSQGVSRIPVREALRQLETEGLVVQVPHAGARVSSISLDECLELYRLREVLEPMVLGQSVTNLTVAQLTSVNESKERLEEAGDDIATWLLEDRTFHLGSFQGAAMPTALGLIERFYNQTQPFRHAYFNSLTPHQMAVVHIEHQLIFDAIERGDSVDAESHQRSHIRRTRLDLIRDPALSHPSAAEPRGAASVGLGDAP
jgi:DNA-binding GntR family transcriptional regulator